MGRIGRKQSLRLMEAAFDAGIRQFDTAPLYGLGAAEAMVGEFAKNKHGDIRVDIEVRYSPTSPFGFYGHRGRLGLGQPSGWYHSMGVKLRRRAEAMTARGSFTPSECRESLCSSVRQLRTESIDLFLMHEVLEEQITGELLETLEEAVQRGWIREIWNSHRGGRSRDYCSKRCGRELPPSSQATYFHPPPPAFPTV